MLTAIVLICSLISTPNFNRDCDVTNALSVIRVPHSETGNPATCFMHAQAYIAETEIGQTLAADERVMVKCTPTRDVEHHLRPKT